MSLLLEEIVTAREREPEEIGWAEQSVLVSSGWLGLPGKSPGHPSDNLCHFGCWVTEGHWLKSGREITLFAHSRLIKTVFSTRLSRD